MAVRWNGPFGDATPDMRGLTLVGLGIPTDNNKHCALVGVLFISSEQDLCELADEYSREFGSVTPPSIHL